MPVRQYKPTSPGRRGMSVASFDELTTKRRYRPLSKPKKQRAGRNNRGKITVRHRGGGHKRQYRLIDFKRDKIGIPARVQTIEYDPNRSGRIALVAYRDGEKRYILAPHGLRVGDKVESGPDAAIRPGNALPLTKIPFGMDIHNIELHIGRGGALVRSAGAAAQLMAREGNYGVVRMPSGEVRRIHVRCLATIGRVSNPDHENVSLGKAGRSRWLGRRPTVRGSVMSPADHPHGGGEAKSPIGGQPKTPWGKPAMGYRTRRRKYTNKFIMRRRTR